LRPAVIDEALRAELLRMRDEDQETIRDVWERAAGADPAFDAELARRTDPETSVIGDLGRAEDAEDTPPAVRRMLRVRRGHRERLREIVDARGWPGASVVGADAARAAWLLAQHAGADRPLQERCARLLREAYERGEAEGEQVAWLTDRWLMGTRREQRYGMLLIRKGGGLAPVGLVDPEHVDDRRRELGLPPLAEWVRHIGDSRKH
jgi:hypothetical protein